MEFFGSDLLDSKDFIELVIRYSVNLFATIIIVRLIYYKIQERKDFLFSFFILNTVIFFICILLNNVKLELGLALGLFAIFGILRYRTEAVPIKEMTYLFVVIGIAVINSLSNKKVSVAELAFTNFAIIGLTYALENFWLLKHESKKIIQFDNIDLIRPENEEELISNLQKRTGLPIHRVDIGPIDFLKDTAKIKAFYYDTKRKIDSDS
ncbi:MAG: hypothetical protein ACI8ZO_000324 [Flavobacteriales bacterium]|jgi:hypothetical protein